MNASDERGNGRPVKTSDVDVLVIGAGPAGLLTAAVLARCSTLGTKPISLRVVEKRSTKIFTGNADGLNPRTMEILRSLDLGPECFDNATSQFVQWGSAPNGGLYRADAHGTKPPGASRYNWNSTHQGQMQRYLLDKIAFWSTPPHTDTREPAPSPGVSVDYATEPVELSLPEGDPSDSDASRIRVKLRHIPADEAQPSKFNPLAEEDLYRPKLVTERDVEEAKRIIKGLPKQEWFEEVNARYVVGSDGAHSWVRERLGVPMIGDQTNSVWGAIDGIPVTDFPGVRCRSNVHAADKGALMMIPREKERVRMYINLTEADADSRFDRNRVTPKVLLERANSIIAPYKLDIPDVEWFTCYEIGQRLAQQWTWKDRILMIGDAVHTHSPKMGQGMNTGLADAYNLAWKLAHAVQGKADPRILATYESERRPFAQTLIEHDRKVSKTYSTKIKSGADGEGGTSFDEFTRTLHEVVHFTAGTIVEYNDSLIVAKAAKEGIEHQMTPLKLAKKIHVGRRLGSTQVVNLASATAFQTGDLLTADGRWRIIIFPGNIAANAACRERLDYLSEWLGESELSPVVCYTPDGENWDSVIECLTIVASSRDDLELSQFHNVLWPAKVKGPPYKSYNKIFVDEESIYDGHGHAYEYYGIDPTVGCAVVVRPDQHVGLVAGLDDTHDIAEFFNRFMISPW